MTPTLRAADDTVTAPARDFGWLDVTGNGTSGDVLRNVVDGALGLALLICALAFILSVAGWVAARASGAAGGKRASFFAVGAGGQLLGMVLLGSLAGATGCGAGTVGQWATTLVPLELELSPAWWCRTAGWSSPA